MLTRRELLAFLGVVMVADRPSGAAASAVPTATAYAQAAEAYAALAVYRFEPAQADEVARRWEEGILAAAKQAPGFLQGLLLTERAAGKGIGMGLWSTKAAADAFGATAAFQTTSAWLAEILLAPYEREEYAVRIGG
jgi:hypothetical protein